MSSEQHEFVPGPMCINPRLCNVSQKCQEVSAINSQVLYESVKRGSSNLEHQVWISKCQSEQAREARRSGNNVLSERWK